MPVMIDGELELGADPVIGGDEQRVRVARRFQVEKSAKSAEFSIRAGSSGRFRQRRDGAHQRIACGNIDTRLSIAVRGRSRAFFMVGHGTCA